MKNFKLFIGALLLVVLVISCKKAVTDDTLKFIGTWTGTNNEIVPGLGSNSSNPVSLTITKGTTADQIVLTQTGTTKVRTANASGSGYTYVEYTGTSTSQGITVSMKMNGSGTLNGSVITESGTVVYTLGGQNYPGTWSSTITKQ